MLYVVRHGETGWNETKKTMGQLDIPLSNIGLEQAEELREKIKDIDIDLILCSPLSRAKVTAKIINEDRNINILVQNPLAERNLGELEMRHYPSYDENKRIWDIDINTDDYHIETMEDFINRVYDYLNLLMAGYIVEYSNTKNKNIPVAAFENINEKNILIVTHGGVSALINCYFNKSLKNGSLTDKFLKNGELASYDTTEFVKNKTKKHVYKPGVEKRQ